MSIDQLAAAAEIRSLKAHYFRFVDSNDWLGLRELFTPEATLFMAADWPAPKSVDEAMASFSAVLTVRDSVHTGTMPSLVLLSPTIATGTWLMDDRLYRHDDHADARLIQGFGTYFERYRLVGDRWLIESLILERRRVDYYGSIGSGNGNGASSLRIS